MNENTPALLAKSYAPAVQKRLGQFPSRDQSSIASWLIQNTVGTNYALQILEHLDDLSRREEASASQIFFRVLASLSVHKRQPKEIGRRLRDDLQRILHPTSGGHQNAFEAWARALPLPDQARVIPPQNFEGKQFTLALAFDSTDDLREKLKASLETLASSEWEKIWSF